MAGSQHGVATKRRARDLVVFQGYAYERVSRLTGVPTKTLQRWASEGGWQDDRRQHELATLERHNRLASVADRMLEKAAESGDPQHVHAYLKLNDELRSGRAALLTEGQRRLVAVEVIEAMVDYLAEEEAALAAQLSEHFEGLIAAALTGDWGTS